MARLRLVFMGTPEFAVPALAALVAAGQDIASVYAQPPRPAGRGMEPHISPVHAFAAARAIPVRTPQTLRDPAEIEALAALGPDAAVVAAYGLILPPGILTAPRLGCINIHASLLPRWRGAAPIQRAIEAGDAETGITIMQMDEGLDTGGILLAERVAIGPATTGALLHDTLARLGAGLVVTALARLAAGTLRAAPQANAGVTYAKKLDRAEARLDWTAPAARLERRVRAFDPWPGTWFEHAGERVRVLAAAVAPAGAPAGVPTGAVPGTVLDDEATVACGAGALRLLRLQRAGKAALAADDFLRGFALARGTVLAS
ncbi:MAG: methionyl-tRNA formyltransferase [Alphaproteobacteria bacterium]|nr:methionyl-tRNA formyltransferase [Alphaproteobacteria bacterium]